MSKDTVEKIPESDISVVQQYSLGDVDKHYKALDKAVRAYKKSFIDIALNLYWLDEVGDCNNAHVDGVFYKNIADYALNKYGISKATTYQYIAIVKKFGKMNPDTGFIDKLDDKYKDFSSTALIVMSGMDGIQLMFCKPDMKIKELKALRDGSAIEDKSENRERMEDESEKGSEIMEKPELEQKEDNTKNNDYIPFDSKSQLPPNRNSQKLFEIKDTEDFEKRSKGIMDTIKRTLSQNNGRQYHVEISMTWD